MARYPTFEDYAKKGNFQDGIKRCDDLLKRNPKDTQLLIVKLRLLSASGQNGLEILDQLAATQPPIQHLAELTDIETAVVESNKDVFPPPSTAGPIVSKLWDAAFKTSNSTEYKLELVSLRFSRAVYDNRLQDAQQTLIAIKAFQPRNRAVYMAHAAYTQLLSSSKDDLQSRLALSLARKAVSENFDEDKALDVRVPGQIFAFQESEKDLESIRDRPFRESQQVYKALKLSEPVQLNSAPAHQRVDPAKATPREWLTAEVESLKEEFSKLIEANAAAGVLKAFVANAIRLFHTAITSLDLGGRDRGAADACFLAVSGLVKLYVNTRDWNHLLQAAYLSERLLKHNENIHEARLVLVYIYMRLGLGKLAAHIFDSLRVKEVQHDTVGHTLFTRLSITHPFQTSEPRDWFDPHERTYKALGIYARHEDKLADCEAGVLDHSQTGMVFDLHELRDSLRLSLARRITALEHRRVARLTGKAVAKNTLNTGPRVVANWTTTKDNRDFNGAFDYGFNVEKALYGSVESSKTLLHDLAADTAWALSTNHTPLVRDSDKLAEAIQSAPSEEPATAQLLAGDVALKLLAILPTPSSKEAFEALAKAIKTLPIESLLQTKDDLAETLTDHYTYVDILRIAMYTCRHIPAATEQEAVKNLQDLSKSLISSVQNHAKAQATSTATKTIRERMLRDEDLRGSIEKFGEEDLERFCEAVVGAAKEGWDGVLKIKMPPVAAAAS
ncbi:hypothetical protein DOTSEDRAFT_180083 [Lecanosticta acicola]|uniref:Uncharacterized protein n=1 Tax=Lecanosticta acicola TaxID=111012 RepID=A0AAI8Z0E1_9PEZI|nr:hypothetical protein DOTSEDRAFT_180083 [Lecanosticta acicola]